MNLNVIELINGKIIVADVEELDEEPSCYMKNCREVVNDTELIKWPKYTDEVSVLIYANRIITMSEPTDTMTELYNKTINS